MSMSVYVCMCVHVYMFVCICVYVYMCIVHLYICVCEKCWLNEKRTMTKRERKKRCAIILKKKNFVFKRGKKDYLKNAICLNNMKNIFKLFINVFSLDIFFKNLSLSDLKWCDACLCMTVCKYVDKCACVYVYVYMCKYVFTQPTTTVNFFGKNWWFKFRVFFLLDWLSNQS